MSVSQTMRKYVARNHVRQYIESIINMFPGTHLLERTTSQEIEKKRYIFDNTGVSINIPEYSLVIKINKHRKFAPKAELLLKNVVDLCLDKDITKNSYWRATLNGIIDSEVARFATPQNHKKLVAAINLYSSWSSQTYEGSRIHHCIGIDPNLEATIPPPEGFNPESDLEVAEYFESKQELELNDKDELKVLGSSANSLLLLDSSGIIDRIELVEPLTSGKMNTTLAPMAFCHLAHWTSKPKGTDPKCPKTDKVAVCLTRNGEILIFSNGKMQFAKRRGTWRYFPHESLAHDVLALPGLELEIDPKIRKAVYLTALDVAFTRGGACLGITEKSTDLDKLIQAGCYLKDKRLHHQIVSARKFQDIPRSLRAELAGIDGATIIDTDGNILCVGAILKTGGNAEGGGGRTAAAKSISQYGMGIKVSNDGNITAYPHGWKEGEEISWA